MTDSRDSTANYEAAARLQRLWEQGRAPRVEEFLAEGGPLRSSELVAVLLVDQRQRWRRGQRPLAEEYFQAFAAVRDDAASAVELIHAEYCLRTEAGERASLEEYRRRFPELGELVRARFELQQVMGSTKSGAETAAAETQDEPGTPRAPAKELWFLGPADEAGVLGRLGHFTILRIIGKGGMGVVLQARDEVLLRVVAVKVLAPQLAASDEARRRFIREARAAAAVSHDHIVTIHAVEEHDGFPFLVMHYIEGESLQDRLARAGTLDVAEIVRIGLQTSQGLAAAHGQGLVHRDIKPGNILLEAGTGRVKITDFGLARAVEDDHLTQSGCAPGTPLYMAPEQAAGEAVDRRADLFSLGTMLYVMCTGKHPFRAGSYHAVLRRVVEDTPQPIHEQNTRIPLWLCAVIARLQQKRPQDRYQSADEVVTALQEQVTPEQASSTPSVSTKRAKLPRWRKVGAPVLLVFLLVGVAWLYWPRLARLPFLSSTPFVLLQGKDQPEQAFGSLAQAVENAHNGATIEVRGNGPFFMEELVLGQKALTIKAGQGHHPVLELRHAARLPPMTMLTAYEPLVLEGLELRYLPDPNSELPLVNMLLVNDSLHMAHCRLLNSGSGHLLCGTGWHSSRVVNCEFLGGPGWSCLTAEVSNAGKLRVDNSLVASRDGATFLLEFGAQAADNAIEMRNTTLCSSDFACRLRFRAPAELAREPSQKSRVSLRSSGNVILAHQGFAMVEWQTQSGPENEALGSAKTLLQRQLAWYDDGNWYDVRRPFCQIEGPAFADWRTLLQTHADWHRFWKQDKGSGSKGRVQFAAGDVFLKMKNQPLRVSAADFRLTRDSAGALARADGKNLGADVDRIGPGPAYHAWTETQEYRDWLHSRGHE